MTVTFYCRCCNKGFFSLRDVRNHVRFNDAIDWKGKRKNTALYIRAYNPLPQDALYSCSCCSMIWDLSELVKRCCPITLLPVEEFKE